MWRGGSLSIVLWRNRGAFPLFVPVEYHGLCITQELFSMKVLFSYPPSPPLFFYFPQLTLSPGYDSIGGRGESNTLMGPVEARQESVHYISRRHWGRLLHLFIIEYRA